jgi:hypothetical protein
MSKPERAKWAIPVKIRSEIGVRSLQNGIGIASGMGIVAILLLVALGPTSPSNSSSPDPSSGTTAPLTSVGDGASASGIPFTPSSPLPPSYLAPSHGSSALVPPSSGPAGPGRSLPGVSATPENQSATSGAPVGATSAPVGATSAPVGATSETTGSSATDPAATASRPQPGPPVSSPPPSTTTTTAAPIATTATRQVEGTAVIIGSGTFVGGTDVAPGLYDVAPGPNQSGEFVVTGTDNYDEVLGSPGTQGVPQIRVRISTGDQIQVSGLSQVFFTPVATPFVMTHSAVTLSAGTWTVGQDLGPGQYVAAPGAGERGTVVVASEGINETVSGDPSQGSAPSFRFNVKDGDVIEISGLGQLTLTPS